MNRHGAWRVLRVIGLVCLCWVAGTVTAQTGASGAKAFQAGQIDQFVAPVALYPDALLSQIFMAATYPADVADAAAWAKANPRATGDAAVKQVSDKPWDPSVQSLVAFPEVLAQMGSHPDWVRDMGDAFLAQPDDVMASVQRLRAQAQKAGNLKSTGQQKVVVQQATPQTTVIQIEPTDPQVVYVPSYNPTVVYGTWAYPAYPPTYWPPPPGYYHPVAAGLAFGTGVAIANSLWGGFDWGHNDVHIDVNRYNNINVNHRISGNGNVNWNHNPVNRRGTPYRDAGTRQRFDNGVGGAQQRQAFRGHDANLDANRQRAMQSFDRQTHGGAAPAARRGGDGAARANRPGGQGAGVRHDTGGARANAFSGVRSPGNASAQMQRGQGSLRGSGAGMQRPGAGAAPHPINRPVPARGGGFHRR